MQTIVGISLSPVYILPLMFTFSIIGRTLLFRVRYFLSDTGHLWYKTHPAVLSGIWLYSIAVALIIYHHHHCSTVFMLSLFFRSYCKWR
uniref:Prepilin peptidase n=1 Tax=Escherichia coli TaxID=562 RepID=A0A3G4RTX7_ECOLX|nr:prepilin peptidase [Escherichia coli]